MKKELIITELSRAAWEEFSKERNSWIMLTVFNIFLIALSILVHFYMPEYKHIGTLLLALPGGIYMAILYKNGLDAAYGRKLSLIHIDSSILFASIFFILISLYDSLPKYLKLLLLILPDDFKYFQLLSWAIRILTLYLSMRCMFVGMILLEENYTALEALKKSFRLTAHHIFLLCGVFMYLAFALGLSISTVVGFFMVLPYTILMKSLLFKKLNEMYP